MIDIKDNLGNVLFTGSIEDAKDFLEHKMKLEKQAKDKDLEDWAFGLIVGTFICFAIMILFKFATS